MLIIYAFSHTSLILYYVDSVSYRSTMCEVGYINENYQLLMINLEPHIIKSTFWLRE